MTSVPLQYDLSTSGGGSAAYEGTPGPGQARQAGDYNKNDARMSSKIRFFLDDFKPINPINDYRS